MGKSNRKRKLKEEDFKKKKLKVGKRLPMPDNVTKTSFKAQTINILQQNQNQDGDEPTNFKRQTLKDLLSSCSHYNTQARGEALFGLKDLIEKHPNVLTDNLGDILQRVLGKITDIESSVRRAFLSLIWSIFTALPEAKMSPFFPTVVAYLGSAMTHLNEGIRMDSMKFLDHCLHHYTRLLSTNSKNIILNLIDVISSEKGGQNPRVPGLLSLKAKVTSQKLQLEVLSRLNRLLGVIFSAFDEKIGVGDRGIGGDSSASKFHGITSIPDGSNTNQDNTRDSSTISSTITASNLHGAKTNTNPASVSPIVPSSLHGPFITTEVTLVSNFSLKSASGGFSDPSSSPSDLFGNEVNLMGFISSLSPVLLEYWVECCPAEFAMNLIPIKKSSVSLQIMREILEVFVTLVRGLEKITEQEVFFKFLKEKLFSQIYGHLFSVFPMSFTSQNAATKKGGKKADVQGNQSISDVSLNLLVCEFLCYFIPDAEQEDNTLPKWAREVVNYLCEVMANKARGSSQQSQINLNDIRSLTKRVMVLILNLPISSDDLKIKLLKNMHQIFEAARGTSNTKKVLLQFLQDLLKHLAHRETSQELKATLDIWLCSLLKSTKNKLDFGSSFVHNIFSICKSGIVQKFPNIATVVKDALPGIFKTENFNQLEEETRQLVVEIFYHLKQTPSKQLYDVLIALCHSGTLSLTVFQYLMQVIYQASTPGTPDEQCSSLPAYLRFVLSIVVGWPQKKLGRFQKQKFLESYNHPVSEDNILVTDPKDYYCYVSKGTSGKDVDTMKQEWQYQKSTTSIVCQYLMLSEFSETLLQMIAPSLSKLLNQDTALPLPVVYRLLYLVKTLLSLAKESNGEKKGLDGLPVCIAKWCAVVWHFSINVNTDCKHGEFFKTILKDFKELISDLVKMSSDILKSILDLLVTYTSHTDSNCTITCQVLTDLFKGPLKDLGEVWQSSLKSLYTNLENAFNAGFVDSQVFSDFKYSSNQWLFISLQNVIV